MPEDADKGYSPTEQMAEARQSPHGTRAFNSVFAWAEMLNKTLPLKPGAAELKCPFAVRVGYREHFDFNAISLAQIIFCNDIHRLT